MSEPQTEQIVRLLTTHQERLFHYIFSLLPHEEDARDVLQETCLALCRKFEDYNTSLPFLPWAYRFAQLEVLKYREHRARRARLFKEEVLMLLAKERAEAEHRLIERLRALDDCLEKLPENDRQLMKQRYRSQVKIEELVEQLGASRRTLFRNLERVRRLLFDCISSRMAKEGVL